MKPIYPEHVTDWLLTRLFWVVFALRKGLKIDQPIDTSVDLLVGGILGLVFPLLFAWIAYSNSTEPFVPTITTWAIAYVVIGYIVHAQDKDENGNSFFP